MICDFYNELFGSGERESRVKRKGGGRGVSLSQNLQQIPNNPSKINTFIHINKKLPL